MTEHEAVFLGRTTSDAQRIASAEATLIACHKLLERAQRGDPAEADGNIRCTAMWLRSTANALDELLKDRARTTD